MAVAKQPTAEEQESMLTFVPAGTGRSVAEYIAAMIPGAVLLFAFFLAAEAAMVALGCANPNNCPTGGSILPVAFVPVICIMPILAGVVSTLILEKLRKKPLTMQRGATVGAAAGLAGALVSAVLIMIVHLFTSYKQPLGIALPGLFLAVAMLVVVVIDAVLGALGGALVVKFIKDV